MSSRDMPRSQGFKRGYIACDSCRSRKVRCIIEGEPPCNKCAREHRVCKFDQRPKTTKHREPPRWVSRDPEVRPEAPIIRSPQASSSRRLSTAQQDYVGAPTSLSQQSGPSPGGLTSSSRQSNPLLSGPTPSAVSDGWQMPTGPSPQAPSVSLSDKVVSAIVKGSNDALDVLSDAAKLHDHAVPTSRSWNSGKSREVPEGLDLPTVVPTESRPGCPNGMGFRILNLSEPTEAVLDVWDKSRFVRQGCFTGQEAVSYIDVFFKYLAPLSPVIVDQFRDHEAHHRLVYEEPMLCCTLLLISSRFFMLPGPGGASRSHFIHQRLWHYTEFLIKRVVFGQEKLSTAKTRNIGMLEGLMLISEWHPRSLHFPPESEGWDALLMSTDIDPRYQTRKNDQEPSARWRHDVFEPAKRANRMSWMVLGVATNLAHELGIFSGDRPNNIALLDDEGRRAHRVQRLLYTHVTQTATRLGYQSVFPESIVIEATHPPADGSSAASSHGTWTSYMNSWIELTRLYRVSSSMFFVSTSHLQHQLLNDNYLDLLENFSVSLSKWEQEFDHKCQGVSLGLSSILLIEYYHLKALVGSIAIQAVVQRASAYSPTQHRKEGLARFLTSRDEKFLREVISDSSMVLRIATMTDFKAQLPLAPARTRLSVISASVFLLKAISIGANDTDTPSALDILEQSTKILKEFPPDDMDFAMRYAGLIDKFTETIRISLLPMSVSSGSTGPSGDHYNPGSVGSNDMSGGTHLQPPLSTPPYPPGEEDGMDIDLSQGLQSEFWRTMSQDSSIAPFSSGSDQLSQGLYIDSLNFLWNLPDPGNLADPG